MINARAKAAGGFKIMQPLVKNKHAEVYYRNAIEQEAEKMLLSLIAKLEQTYTTVHTNNAPVRSVKNIEKLLDSYKKAHLSKFLKNAEKIINKYVKLATHGAKSSAIKVLKELYGSEYSLHVDKREVDEIMSLIVRQNIGLIQNTALQTLNNVENIVFNGMKTGQNWRIVAKDLKTQSDIEKDRINRIARDQTAKANEALNELQQREAGVEFFIWRTAQDERVSEGYGGHKQLNGKIYKWGDTEHYPVIDTYGHRGLPAERVNCRCTALAVLLRKDYEARQLPDGSYEIIKGRI